MSVKALGTIFGEILIKIIHFFLLENTFCVAREMAARFVQWEINFKSEILLAVVDGWFMKQWHVL